jgi:hypothetical protein
MYQAAPGGLLSSMSTLHRLGEAAVRRDLHRARVVLASASPLRASRRVPLCDHLVWMTELVGGGDAVVQNAAAAVHGAARAFSDEGDRGRRIELVGALGSFHRVTGRREGWIARSATPALQANTPWLLDGVSGHAGAGLVLDAEDRLQARIRVEQYRRWRIEMWGPVALSGNAVVLVR